MASTVYNMGQYRYPSSSSSNLMYKENVTPYYLDWQIDTSSSPYYRDILLQKENGAFERNASYYLTFGIPRNLNYDLNFSIKLLRDYDGYIYNSAKTVFEFIRYISTKRTMTDGSSNSLICLYQLERANETETITNPEKDARTAIRYGEGEIRNPIESDIFPSGEDYTISKISTPRFFYDILDPIGVVADSTKTYTYYPNVLYHDILTDTYWMFEGQENKIAKWEDGIKYDPFGEDNIVRGTNDVIINWSWQQNFDTNMTYYNIIFTPTANGVDFSYILLQLERISEDVDIVNQAVAGEGEHQPDIPGGGTHPGRGKAIYGRYVDLDQKTGKTLDETIADTFKVYKLTNLNANNLLDSQGKTIVHFGIWSHPELMMAVNGEEIHVGPSGYYELNDFEVKSLCVVANGIEDSFTLDYQYAE